MRPSSSVIKLTYPVAFGLALSVACGGASKSFSDREGDDDEPASGGSSGGSTGAQGGAVASGGNGGVSPNGGNAGEETGGSNSSGGAVTGGASGEGSGGASGAATGGSEQGGMAGDATGGVAGQSGGFAGQSGGFAGVGGMADERCPPRPPSAGTECMPDGLTCRYDLSRQCLCISPQAGSFCMMDPRCTTMAGDAARIIFDGGVGPDGGGAVPIPTTTCTCLGTNWRCVYP